MSTNGHANGGGRIAASLWVLRLAFRAAPRATIAMAVCTIAIGVLPAAAAYVGKWIVDTVVLALPLRETGWGQYKPTLWMLVALEGSLIGLLVAAQRAQSAAQAILKTRISNRVAEMILAKATTLELAHFEDPEVHDRLTRARRDAGVRPYNLVTGIFVVARNLVTLAASIVVLLALSWWAVLIVVLAGLPAFVAELSFSQQIFDQQRRRTPEQREQAYLEAVLTREDFAKEVKLYELAEPLLERFRTIASRIEQEERAITLRRNWWGTLLNLIGTAAFYLAYAWIVRRTVNEHLTLGQMTMYLVIFRQAQQGVTQGLASLGMMLDDHLYLRDLESFLALPIATVDGTRTSGLGPRAGLVVKNLSFTYPGATVPALENVSFTIAPGEIIALVGQNGSGKTTLIKLITRLYDVPRGRIFLDGLDVLDWDVHALRHRFAPVFQDFVRFRMKAGENVGAGDVEHWYDEQRWIDAAKLGLAHDFVSELPEGYHTQLGKWFKGGQELSGGQWQKIALSRAFMREQDAILVLDEPTSALDPDAEVKIFEHVQQTRGQRMVLLISHRFGSVRMADRIVVLDEGRVVEQGPHDALIENEGLYARLFKLQAAGYLGRNSLAPAREADDSD
ncbi:ABC transporter ATP-binding protein [Sandaracinus amylolyticus]|uniref:ABC transporter ATP-binding protein n=1 Tax=Sandaracinus amylolyticus TaxID=927083 RepID=UPI001F306ADB|nr:ABC transporter ATP-binding protein [Sandaracinus amylolyticus]UJR80841.1 ABC-type multidrug transport system, ATPase and permease component [Sandaracinus amylolyticus]